MTDAIERISEVLASRLALLQRGVSPLLTPALTLDLARVVWHMAQPERPADRHQPCPTCGFRVVRVERAPFVID